MIILIFVFVLSAVFSLSIIRTQLIVFKLLKMICREDDDHPYCQAVRDGIRVMGIPVPHAGLTAGIIVPLAITAATFVLVAVEICGPAIVFGSGSV